MDWKKMAIEKNEKRTRKENKRTRKEQENKRKERERQFWVRCRTCNGDLSFAE